MRAFLQSAKDGDAGALRALLDAGGAELLEFRGAGTPDGVSGNTAAHWAAARGHTAALEVLLRAGAPVGATNHGGSTALQAAVLNSHAEVVRLLRRHGADADAQDEYGDSALDLAQRSQRNQAELLRALTEPLPAPGPPPISRPSSQPVSWAAGFQAAGPHSVSRAAGLRADGNAAFAAQQHARAIELYTAALRESAGEKEVEGVLWSNVSACHAACAEWERALEAATEAVRLRPEWAKAHSRAGAALHAIGRLDEAEAAYLRALELGDGTPASAGSCEAGGGERGGKTRGGGEGGGAGGGGQGSAVGERGQWGGLGGGSGMGGKGGGGIAVEGLSAVRRAQRMRRLEELIDRGAFDRRREAVHGGKEGGAVAGGGGAVGGPHMGGRPETGLNGVESESAPAAVPLSGNASPKPSKTAAEVGVSDLGRGAEAGLVGAESGIAAPAVPPSGVASRKPGKTAAEVEYAVRVRAWMAAAKAGRLAELKIALEEAPWLLTNRSENTAEKQLGNSALHWAAANGQTETVRWLLSMPGLDVNIRNEGGGTPLHSAAAHGRSAAVEALLAADAIPSLTDSAGDTPAHAAWRRGHRHTEGLIDRGALAPAVRWDSPGVGARPGGWEEAKAAGNAAFAKGSVPCLRRAVWSYTDAFLLLALTGQAEAESSRGQREHASLERQELTTKRSEAGSLPGLERTASFGGQELLPATVKQAAAEGLPSREEPDSLGLQQQEAVLRSNRSAAHARLSQFALSLEDADAAVALRPEWGKGHGRRGAALAGLGRWREAEAAYRDGLQVELDSASLQQGLQAAVGQG